MTEGGKVERELSTRELVEHAIAEVKMLAKAEVLYAKLELREDLQKATRAGMAVGAGAVLALCGLSLFFAALAFALPIATWGALLIVGGVLLVAAAISITIGLKRVPKKPLRKTQERLLDDVRITREQFA